MLIDKFKQASCDYIHVSALWHANCSASSDRCHFDDVIKLTDVISVRGGVISVRGGVISESSTCTNQYQIAELN